MTECCCLWLYHDASPACRANLKAFRKSNPDVPVAGLAYEWAPALPGVDCHFLPKPARGVREFEANEERTYLWMNSDSRVLDAAPDVAEAKRYLLVEWDTLVTVDVKDWFGPLWDQPVAAGGSVMERFRDPWVWFDQANDRIHPDLMSHLCGITPLSGILFSADALKRVSEMYRRYPCPNAFCELRVGTLCRAAGFTPQQRPGGNLTCVHDGRLMRSDWRLVPGFYHPVKADPEARKSPPANWREELLFDDADFEQGKDPVLQVLRRLVSALAEAGRVPQEQKAVAAYRLAVECLRLNDDPSAAPAHHTLNVLRRYKA